MSLGSLGLETRVPTPLLEVLGVRAIAKFIEVEVGKSYSPLDIEEFLWVLRSVAQPFIDKGYDVVGIMDPLWAPARFVKRVPLVVFKQVGSVPCGVAWKLYRVEKHLYLQMFSTASIKGLEELYSPSERIAKMFSLMGVDLANLLMGPELLNLEPAKGLESTVIPCVGERCSGTDLETLIEAILESTSKMFGFGETLVVVVGNPRSYGFEKAPTIWLPSTFPSSLEILDDVVEGLGKRFSICKLYVSLDTTVWGSANFLVSYPRSPIEAILSDVCRSVEVVVDGDDECTSVRSMS